MLKYFEERIHDKRIGILFIIPCISFFLILIIYPLFYTITLSLYDRNYFTGELNFIGLQYYYKLAKDPVFWRAFNIGIIWTFFSILGQLALGLGAALLINRETRYIGFFRSFLLIPYIIPAIATALTWRWMLNDYYGIITFYLAKLGIVKGSISPLAEINLALPSVIIVNIWRGFPFTMIVYWAALQAIPREQYEAAKVDGATPLREFLYITLPHLKHITLVLLILRTIWVFNYFDLIYLLTRGGPAGATQHLPIMVYITSFGMLRFGEASAIAVLMGLFLIILITIYIKLYGFKEV